MKCKACRLKFSKLIEKKEFSYPTNIPISKDMRATVDALRAKTNNKKHK